MSPIPNVSLSFGFEVVMRALRLLDGASFGLEAMLAIGQAFESAWTEIDRNFGDDPADIADARYKLANALLSVAREDSRDVDVLKKAALQQMALEYRESSPSYGELKRRTRSRST
jgi:hypothetical protein